MKILNIHTHIKSAQLLQLLQQKLNPLFKQQRQSDLTLNIQEKESNIEVSLPELYEGFLFSISINGTELHITRSDHYVDDVNSLTIESILNSLFEELAGKGNVTLVLEG